ncbi:PAS domain-containing protein [Dyadobacter sp. NIV53]|uniref:PAS domain-containing protein n=1 Tax=Dyadobacter sp. NIV53 TaxID=2861765 RepID=UPI001C884527|nr:PAS domain-containing protein [Dyadobacter sp. NIV53]
MVAGTHISNESFLADIQRLAKIGSWEADPITKKVKWSDVMKEIHEVDHSFQPDFSAIAGFFKEGRSKNTFFEVFEDALENGTPFDVELLIITGKGNKCWVRCIGNTEWQNGECIRIYGSVQDINKKKMFENEVVDSRNRFQSLIQAVDGIVWEADAQTLEAVFVSDQVWNILGYTPHEWLSEPGFWQNHIHPADRERILGECSKLTGNLKNQPYEYRMISADGNSVWFRDSVSVLEEKGKPKWLRGMLVNITEMKRLIEFENLEKTILELNSVKDISIQEVLMAYVKGIEAIFPKLICSIIQIKNNTLHNWASPSLPGIYVDAIEGLPVAENTGSCGTAAFYKEKVIVSDIANDIRWANYKDLALANNLTACWSHPIISSEGVVMATFAIYYNEIKTPAEEELKVIDRSVAILKVLLENRESSEIIEEKTSLMVQSEELAHFGNWQWNLQNNTVSWSDSLYSIYGLSRDFSKSTHDAYQSLLHPADRKRVNKLIHEAIDAKKDVEYEERIIRPSGEIRHLKSWGKVKLNKQGVPVKMMGACLDITETKGIQENLLASESRLRNLVNALTSYVIRTDLNGNFTYYNCRFIEDFGWFYRSDKFMGANFMLVVQPKDHHRVAQIAENCLKYPGKVYPVELDNIQEGATARSVLWHFICLTDSRGEPSEIQCVGLDVSERKEAECALRLSNERYEYVNKATNDAIYDWNVVSNSIEWGDGFYRLFGYVTGKDRYPVEKWASQIHSSEREKILGNLKQILEDRTQFHWNTDYQFMKMDGNYAYVEENGLILRDNEGRAFRMIGVLRDVTKQKQEEYRLKILESAITHTRDYVLIAEAGSLQVVGLKILYANRALTNLTGYTLEELIGKSILSFKDPYGNRSSFNKIIAAIKNRIPVVRETIQYKKEGEQFWINISLNPVMNDKGVLTHWICTGHDVTERMNYTTAIEKQNQKLQEIAWTQSHVVRAPLARLMGLINLISNYHNSDAEKEELLEHILLSAHEFDKIIRDISDNTREQF